MQKGTSLASLFFGSLIFYVVYGLKWDFEKELAFYGQKS